MVVEQTSHQSISNGIKLSVVDIPKMATSLKRDSYNLKPKSKGSHRSYVTMFASEVMGTGLLMFLGCMGCVSQYDEPEPSHHFGGLTFGLVIMLIIQIFGHISGAHLNPAVTLATLLFGIVKPIMGAVYVVAQFVGASLGYGLLKILLSDAYAPEGFCATTINPKLTAVQGLGLEIVLTMVLIFVCCSVWDKRNETKIDSVALRFGLAISAIAMAAGPLTGASMNTARSFAPLIFGGDWKHHWVYWVGPNVGAVAGCGLYKFFFSEPEPEENEKRESIFMDEVAPQPAEKV